MGNNELVGASPEGDRAGGPTDLRRAASQPEALIPSASALQAAISRALGFHVARWESERVAEALHDAGFAIVPLHAGLHAEAMTADGQYEWQTVVRVNARVDPRMVGAMGMIEASQLDHEGFCSAFSRDLARKALRPFESELAARIAQAIEARRAETGTGSVHESAVAESDAPDPNPHPKRTNHG